MKKLIFYFSILLMSIQFVNAQVVKKVVVEHFTNTRCGPCASRNPGLYTNINNQNGIIHLAIHPSSPYANCFLSLNNPSENDGRTNYYGIFGGTPRIVVQGSVISAGANYSSSSIFTPYLGQTSPASIKIYQTKYGNDSINSRIVIKTEAAHTLNNLSLFVALAEDTVNYTGTNGEPIHYDVFRKSLSSTSGFSVTLPANVGDSVVYSMSSNANLAWNFSRIFTLVILQDAITKEVLQSENIAIETINITTEINSETINNIDINVYFSESSINIDQNKKSENLNFSLYDASGRILLTKFIESSFESVNVSAFSPGIYFYRIKSTNGFMKSGKILIY